MSFKSCKVWSKLRNSPSDKSKYPQIEGQGIYVLTAPTANPIMHPYDTDDSKIMYIGKSVNLFINRPSCVVLKNPPNKAEKRLEKKGTHFFNHHCLYYVVDIHLQDDKYLLTFNSLRPNNQKGYLKNETRAEIFFFNFNGEDKQSISKKEALLLKAFVNRFGSLPPFNSSGCSLQTAANYDEDSLGHLKISKENNLLLNNMIESIKKEQKA